MPQSLKPDPRMKSSLAPSLNAICFVRGHRRSETFPDHATIPFNSLAETIGNCSNCVSQCGSQFDKSLMDRAEHLKRHSFSCKDSKAKFILGSVTLADKSQSAFDLLKIFIIILTIIIIIIMPVVQYAYPG